MPVTEGTEISFDETVRIAIVPVSTSVPALGFWDVTTNPQVDVHAGTESPAFMRVRIAAECWAPITDGAETTPSVVVVVVVVVDCSMVVVALWVVVGWAVVLGGPVVADVGPPVSPASAAASVVEGGKLNGGLVRSVGVGSAWLPEVGSIRLDVEVGVDVVPKSLASSRVALTSAGALGSV